jgi:hypothetical protein
MAEPRIEQPGRRVIQTTNGELILEWDPRFANRRMDAYNRAQRFLDTQVLYKSEEFIPVRTGELIQSGRRATIIGSGWVIWNAKYARPVYYGRRAPGRKGPKVTRPVRWFARMKSISGPQIVEKTRKIAGGSSFV